MDTRSDFLKRAIWWPSGANGLSSMLPESKMRAMAINPEKGSTYPDAELVVILMQENRSHHCLGTLQGVRGFNDPRANNLSDKNLVWMQTNEAGKTYWPLRLDIRNTKATWISSAPPSRESQIDGRKGGNFDNRLPAKRVSDKRYANIPLTMGYYTREDIPFYYTMADAFSVCDQNFCSALTSTNPNRLFFWTGTIKERPTKGAKTIRRNLSDDNTWRVLHFDTFLKRLEAKAVSWKFYQNAIDFGGGFAGGQRAWPANFGCNPLEWFANYNVKFSLRYIRSLQKQGASLPNEIKDWEGKIQSDSLSGNALKKSRAAVAKNKEVFDRINTDLREYTQDIFNRLSEKEKNLCKSAFSNNSNDPDYRSLADLLYYDKGTKRGLSIPKGDVIFQYRKDVESAKLPTLSWLAAQNLSDHPGAPWHGSLSVSEILNILTKNPEVWKKTIFIVNFDENDGYFDHIPPFVAAGPLNQGTARWSPAIKTDVECVELENELNECMAKREARAGPIGLGFRVPLLTFSPCSRGGRLCSQVFDHTSTLQFLETLIKKIFGKDARESNISQWRRTVTGDLTAVFKSYKVQKRPEINFPDTKAFIEKIYNAKFTKDDLGFKQLSEDPIFQTSKGPFSTSSLPRQEKGTKPACALPYPLYAEGKLSGDKKKVELKFSAKNEIFAMQSKGAPFNLYFPGKFASIVGAFEEVGSRCYAVAAPSNLIESLPVRSFENDIYHLRVYGPNGFFREYSGIAEDPDISIIGDYERPDKLMKKLPGNRDLKITNLNPNKTFTIEIRDNVYKSKYIRKTLAALNVRNQDGQSISLNLIKSSGRYFFSVWVPGGAYF